ncbi:1-deoxy-D-xylulose-5-phosphate reductoisomerase [Egibacter rhizosphaerae]|uniref:1-deoxy-D-xylulose 5-phosphate reductoisomerase n=1 Tax=Egibacter rhizosphaerae TaxID=1670831 RepID=A0A411YCH5_9ACTN|nr:1-deoxy-D-xylulose-5-phosphate reductoisomerase [Egibacter rhizosphaerae]QBI18953.1 1-deoxy-D-xylulose-5-phosphate reductoisomerase [Egibacter rhizosphaerae]
MTVSDAASGATTVAILGSTGSIGRQALEVVDASPGRFDVIALAGGRNVGAIAEQAERYGAGVVVMADPEAAARLRSQAPVGVTVRGGADAIVELAGRPADVVLNGIAGAAGLRASLAALEAGNWLALANKESLIVGGRLLARAAGRGRSRTDGAPRTVATEPPLSGVVIPHVLPVDSEHSALAQALRGVRPEEVARLVVTASGGPFRGWRRADLEGVRPEDALRHPTWDMGALITINSATLANKGLEVIEAHLLFGVAFDAIEVILHPQSVVHGMVEMVDGATIAKLSPPDMRLPIQLALGAPARVAHAPARLDWTAARTLAFEPVDRPTFPMLDLALTAGRSGGTAPAVYNAANEVAVEAFLAGELGFLGIPAVVAAVLDTSEAIEPDDVDTVLEVDAWARARAHEHVSGSARHTGTRTATRSRGDPAGPGTRGIE